MSCECHLHTSTRSGSQYIRHRTTIIIIIIISSSSISINNNNNSSSSSSSSNRYAPMLSRYGCVAVMYHCVL